MLKRLPNLNSLRFFLATLVAIYHIPQFCAKRNFPSFSDWPVFHKGQAAVWMFFALSGFLIIRQLYQEKVQTDKINLKHFYRNRILRIFPLYYLILIFGFLYYKLILPSMGFVDESDYPLGLGIVLGATFFSNILATFNPGGILEILWSISIEEQFYLLIAPVVWILPRRNMLVFFLLFTLVYFILFYSDLVPFLQDYRMMFYFFSMSGVWAILSLKFPNFIFPYWFRWSVILLLVFYFTTSVFMTWGNGVYQVVSLILIPFSIWILSQKPIAILENSILDYFGKISYGIYMYHPIIMNGVGFVFLKFIQPEMMSPILFILAYNFLVIGFTLFTSHLSYQYFEKFFLKKKNSFRKVRVIN